MTDDKNAKWQTMCPTDTYKKRMQMNDMPIPTHYQNITCSALLSWLMV